MFSTPQALPPHDATAPPGSLLHPFLTSRAQEAVLARLQSAVLALGRLRSPEAVAEVLRLAHAVGSPAGPTTTPLARYLSDHVGLPCGVYWQSDRFPADRREVCAKFLPCVCMLRSPRWPTYDEAMLLPPLAAFERRFLEDPTSWPELRTASPD